MPHFLQSAAWEGFQRSLNREVVHLAGSDWEVRAYLEKGRLNSRLYAPYGPVVSSRAGLAQAIQALREEAAKRGAAYVRVEPTGISLHEADLQAHGLRRAPRKQPEHTQVIDLTQPFDEVLAGMRKTLRNLHRNFHKKGLQVRSSDHVEDVEHLIRLLGEVTDRTGMHAHDAAYLRATAAALMPIGAAQMFLVEFDEAVVAASLVFDDAECRYYAHAAADNAHRNLHPGSILVTSMMQDASERGQARFDLYGVVPPEEADHPWAGFSNFKRSFGGHQVDYAGTWELPVRRVNYRIYRALRTWLERSNAA